MKRPHPIWNDVPDKEFLETIRKEIDRIGSSSCLKYQELRDRNVSPSWGTIYNRFGSWENVLSKIERIGDNNIRFWVKKPRELILKSAANKIEQIGTLSKHDYAKHCAERQYDVPTYTTLCNIFGSWNEFVEQVRPLLSQDVKSAKLSRWTQEEIELALQHKHVPYRTEQACAIVRSRYKNKKYRS